MRVGPYRARLWWGRPKDYHPHRAEWWGGVQTDHNLLAFWFLGLMVIVEDEG